MAWLAHELSSPSPFLFEILRIERFEILRQETAVLPDEFTVEPDLAAAPFRALDEHHVPMHGGTVAVVAFLVRLAGSEVQRAGDLLIEKDIAHRTLDIGIEPEGELTDVARAGIGIQDLVQA